MGLSIRWLWIMSSMTNLYWPKCRFRSSISVLHGTYARQSCSKSQREAGGMSWLVERRRCAMARPHAALGLGLMSAQVRRELYPSANHRDINGTARCLISVSSGCCMTLAEPI
jgi:hypothetical protein